MLLIQKESFNMETIYSNVSLRDNGYLCPLFMLENITASFYDCMKSQKLQN